MILMVDTIPKEGF